ncbi:lipid droplet-associated protein [Mycobacterium sp. pUA109]|uniref:lipid droplet-associated protein n=1 Tax=Mycobacterium sp. pUA109 TaxID=3238982 RepID=UPI00351ADE90
MGTAPYGVRLLVGAATVAAEETKKLPQTILMYPMTLASQAAHLVMRWQQSLAELAVKGDATLETLFPPKDEQPEWATFDEDLDDADDVLDAAPGTDDTERRTEGRFALYSLDETDPPAESPAKPAKSSATATTVPAPDVAAELGYDGLTLAQLRARLHSLSLDDLEALLAYEEASKARAPFQTLLANRITRATAK